jgi:hypothetical protein
MSVGVDPYCTNDEFPQYFIALPEVDKAGVIFGDCKLMH